MPKNNSEQKEKPLAGISLKMACGSKMALFCKCLIWFKSLNNELICCILSKMEVISVEESLKYQPEYNLLHDAYLGSKDVLQKKLVY